MENEKLSPSYPVKRLGIAVVFMVFTGLLYSGIDRFEQLTVLIVPALPYVLTTENDARNEVSVELNPLIVPDAEAV